jgi:hypothetical protein
MMQLVGATVLLVFKSATSIIPREFILGFAVGALF